MDTQFWLYNVNKHYWSVIEKKLPKMLKIDIPKTRNLQKNDRIIIYVKSVGFVATCFTDGIFENDNLKIYNLIIFSKKLLLSSINNNNYNYTSRSFINKYVVNSTIKKLNTNIANYIIQEIDKINSTSKKVKSQSKSKSNSKSKSKSKEKKNKVEDYSSKYSEDEKDEENNTQHKNGFIPVLVILCEDFVLPKEKKNDNDIDENGNTRSDIKRIKKFCNHIKDCNKCKINNNNNNNDIFNYIPNKIKMFCEINEKDIEYEYVVNSYLIANKFNPFEEDSTNLMKIYYVNKSNYYNNCIFIAWVN